MTFDQAENAFRELHARVRRGQVMSRTEFERRTQDLAVVDQTGTTWEIHPRTNQWMFFDGSDWQPGIPPGRAQSVVDLPPALPSAPPEDFTSPETLQVAPRLELPRLVDLPMTPQRAPIPASPSDAPASSTVGPVLPIQAGVPGTIRTGPEVPAYSVAPLPEEQYLMPARPEDQTPVLPAPNAPELQEPAPAWPERAVPAASPEQFAAPVPDTIAMEPEPGRVPEPAPQPAPRPTSRPVRTPGPGPAKQGAPHGAPMPDTRGPRMPAPNAPAGPGTRRPSRAARPNAAAPNAAANGGWPQLPIAASNREWIALTVGAVVLFLCGILFFAGGRLALRNLASSSPTIAQVIAVPTSTRVPTLAPTAAARPTPAATATATPVTAVVIEPRVNVRSDPSTQGKIVGKIQKDESITLVGRNADGTWYQAVISGLASPGWVFAETVTVTAGDPMTLALAK